jgi:hypothetical protein
LDEIGHGGVPEKSPAPARNETPFRAIDSEPVVPLRYRIEFTIGQSYVDQLEEARNLLQHQVPNRDIARIHELAMAMFVERLRKRRGAASAQGRRVESEQAASSVGGKEQPIVDGSAPERIEERSVAEGSAPERIGELSMAEGSAPERIGEAFESDESAPGWISEQPQSVPERVSRASVTEGFVPDRIGQASMPNGFAPERIGKVMPFERCALQRINDSLHTGDTAPEPISEPSPSERPAPAPMKEPSSSERSAPARRATTNRHIPVVMRRHVWARDGGRCTFSDASGRRCHERSGLEVHHDHAFALGGCTTVENLRLLCRAHNALFAERDFGHEHIERMRNGRRPK